MSKAITKMRKIYKDSYILLRRLHLKRVVSRDKRAHTGAWVLSKEQERAAKDFFRDYRPIDLLYHNFYTEKRGEFSAEYLPDDLYYGYVDMAYNDHQAALVFDNKCLYPQLPRIDFIGWDFTVDQNEKVVVIEYNIKCPGLLCQQYVNGPLFGEFTEQMLEKYLKKR